MWLLPSKHADKKLKNTARQLAAALPASRFLPRGERTLERFQELACREAEDTILVVSSSNHPSSFILRARQFSGSWSWLDEELVISEFEIANAGAISSPPIDSGEPYAMECKTEASRHLASFLGLHSHPLAPYYDDLPVFELEAEEKKGAKKNQSGRVRLLLEAEPLLSFQCLGRPLMGRKEQEWKNEK